MGPDYETGGHWIVPLKSRINLQTRLGALLEFREGLSWQALVASGEKIGNFCQRGR